MTLTEEQEVNAIKTIIELIEKVVLKRGLPREHHRDEVEMYFSYMMQGKDELNPHERRAAGVQDLEWNSAIKEFKLFLGLK